MSSISCSLGAHIKITFGGVLEPTRAHPTAEARAPRGRSLGPVRANGDSFARTEPSEDIRGLTQGLEARAEKLEALVDRACRVPGQYPGVLRDEILRADYRPAMPSLTETFGAGATEAGLRAALEPKHPDVVLRDEDFMAITPRGWEREVGLFGVVSDPRDQEPLGYFLWDACRRDSSKRLYDRIEYICAQARSGKEGDGGGIGTAILDAGSDLFASHGSESTVLEAAWLGRYRWAMDGFDFPSELARTNRLKYWNAFCRQWSLDQNDLYFDRGNGEREAFSEESLQHIWDYGAIRSDKGPLSVPARIVWSAKDTQGTYEVGKAFLLAVPPDGWNTSRFGGINFRTYHAVRPHDPNSEGQQQRLRYRAARKSREIQAQAFS